MPRWLLYTELISVISSLDACEEFPNDDGFHQRAFPLYLLNAH